MPVRTSCCVLLLTLFVAPPALGANPQDGITLRVARGTTPAVVSLTWSAASEPYTVYRSTGGAPDASPANALTTTSQLSWNDIPPAGTVLFYRVTATPFWKRDITTAPLDPQSSAIIANLN